MLFVSSTEHDKVLWESGSEFSSIIRSEKRFVQAWKLTQSIRFGKQETEKQSPLRREETNSPGRHCGKSDKKADSAMQSHGRYEGVASQTVHCVDPRSGTQVHEPDDR